MTQERLYAGPNRQMAESLCSGDIIIYQDDDDLPHQRRVEVVKKIFEQFDIVSLNHSYSFLGGQSIPFEKTRMFSGEYLYKKYFPNDKLEDCKSYGAYGHGFEFSVHAGVVCIRKELLKDIKWKHHDDLKIAPYPKEKTEDFEFCFETLFYKKNSVIIDAPIYYYKR